MSGPPSLSRRDLLRAGTVGAGAALAGCVGSSAVSFEPWTPPEGTWPLARYGPGNSGHNPNAAPPREGVESAWQIETDVSTRGLVVAHGLVVTYGREGMALVPRSDPEPRDVRTDDVPTEAAGFGPRDERGRDHLYTAGSIGQRDDAPMGLVRGWVYHSDGNHQSFWTTYEGAGPPNSLVTSADTLYLGAQAGVEVVTVDAENGDTGWRVIGSYPALTEGRLVTNASGRLSSYAPRGGLDARLEDGPAETWTARGSVVRPTLVDGRVFTGESYFPSIESSVYGYDAETGERLWEPRSLGDSPNTPAVVGETGYVSTSAVEDSGSDSASTGGALVALDLGDGAELWRDETDWWHHPAVAGGNGVVIAYGGRSEGEEQGRVRAYDADAGEELWTHATPSPVDSVALVRESVYASTRDGRVLALRAA